MYGGVVYTVYDFLTKKIDSEDISLEYRKALLDVFNVLADSINLSKSKNDKEYEEE